MLHKFAGQDVLLLQGPPGPFFRRVADELEAAGARVTKINFNPGDDLFFSGPNVIRFRDRMQHWPGFLERFVSGRALDAVLLFGDCRPIHRDAIEVLARVGIDVFVFEEGYLRPDFITLEQDGVNGRSRMSGDPDFYRRAAFQPREDIAAVGHTLFYAAWYSWVCAFVCSAGGWLYPHYRHHKDLNIVRQSLAWSRAILRKLSYRIPERRLFERLTSELQHRYFLVPLQCHHDYQLSHSSFRSIDEFIEVVVASFAEHRGPEHHLVFKHHPIDRAYTNYSALLAELAARHGLSGRIHYLHDEHLPTLLKYALGVVVINSTVGLSSIHHDTPVKCLGDAVYDIAGLTFQGTLDEFWRAETRVDAELYRYFRGWLEHNNQLNGSIWRPDRLKSDGPAEPARRHERHRAVPVLREHAGKDGATAKARHPQQDAELGVLRTRA
jgi:capsule polysaccharide modification protein KpsS